LLFQFFPDPFAPTELRWRLVLLQQLNTVLPAATRWASGGCLDSCGRVPPAAHSLPRFPFHFLAFLPVPCAAVVAVVALSLCPILQGRSTGSRCRRQGGYVKGRPPRDISQVPYKQLISYVQAGWLVNQSTQD